jgi:peptidoglycan/xylan/chitin deacetylase (PgdA/CDA1 family)
MDKTYRMSKYVLDNYTVKNLVVCIGIMDAVKFIDYGGSVTDGLHYKITDGFFPAFYSKYLFAHPKYGMTKIDYYNNHKSYLPKFFDVFDTDTGAYDDRLVNIEHIGGLDEYIQAKPAFKKENRYNPASQLKNIDKCVDRIAEIKYMCVEKDVNFTLVFMPSYYELIEQLDMTRVAIFYNKLAAVSDFWDFFLSSASCEPRYFQDFMHARTALGAMAFAKAYGDESVYVPEDFGFYVTAENNWDYAGDFWVRRSEAAPEPGQAAQFKALVYKNIDSNGVSNENNISPARFEEHMKALSEAGYNAISVQNIIDFVEKGAALPENPVLITFDDGYLSVYDHAYPVLKKYGMKAAVFTIGVSMGTDKYRNTDIVDMSYLGWDEAKRMTDSGVFEIGSHSYDMHLYPPFEPNPESCRDGMARLPGESEKDYIAALRQDIESYINLYEQKMGKRLEIFSFPSGKYNNYIEVLLCEYGIKATFTLKDGENEILKGLPQSLYGLNRCTVSGAMSADDLLRLLES